MLKYSSLPHGLSAPANAIRAMVGMVGRSVGRVRWTRSRQRLAVESNDAETNRRCNIRRHGTWRGRRGVWWGYERTRKESNDREESIKDYSLLKSLMKKSPNNLLNQWHWSTEESLVSNLTKVLTSIRSSKFEHKSSDTEFEWIPNLITQFSRELRQTLIRCAKSIDAPGKQSRRLPRIKGLDSNFRLHF